METFSKINLSDLPDPVVVTELSVDEIYIEAKADFKANFPEYAEAIEFESEPIAALMQSWAYRESQHRAFINQAVKSSLLAFSEGPELQHIAALIPLEINDGESDADFRARVQLAPEGFSVAGPDGAYEFFTKAVSAEILDVYVASPEPGFIDVYIYQALPITPARLAEIKAAVDPKRPLTDDVSYLAFDPENFDVAAALTLAAGYLAADVLPAAEAAARAYIETRTQFGKAVYKNALGAAMQIEGVENVALTAPAADIRPALNAVANLVGFQINEAANA